MMSEVKAFVYGRVGNSSQLEAGKKAWLFLRMPYAQPDTLLLKWKQLQGKAKERGYQVVDTTVVTGDDTLSKAAISYIVEHNDPKNGAEVIFTLTGHDLSRDLAIAQDIVGMITKGGMAYCSADESHVMLDIHDPVGAVLKAVLSGAEDYPYEDGDFDEDDDLMDDEGLVFSM